jgi:hypothetical protein
MPHSNTFTYQSDFGTIFDISSIAVGKILTKHGLKKGRLPTSKAKNNGYVKLDNGIYVWNTHKTKKIISKYHKELDEEEKYTCLLRKIITNAYRLINSNDPNKMQSGETLLATRYFGIPTPVIEKIKYKVEFELSLKRYVSVDESILDFIQVCKYNDKVNLNNTGEMTYFRNMIERYYPEYLETLNIYLTFS